MTDDRLFALSHSPPPPPSISAHSNRLSSGLHLNLGHIFFCRAFLLIPKSSKFPSFHSFVGRPAVHDRVFFFWFAYLRVCANGCYSIDRTFRMQNATIGVFRLRLAAAKCTGANQHFLQVVRNKRALLRSLLLVCFHFIYWPSGRVRIEKHTFFFLTPSCQLRAFKLIAFSLLFGRPAL